MGRGAFPNKQSPIAVAERDAVVHQSAARPPCSVHENLSRRSPVQASVRLCNIAAPCQVPTRAHLVLEAANLSIVEARSIALTHTLSKVAGSPQQSYTPGRIWEFSSPCSKASLCNSILCRASTCPSISRQVQRERQELCTSSAGYGNVPRRIVDNLQRRQTGATQKLAPAFELATSDAAGSHLDRRTSTSMQ